MTKTARTGGSFNLEKELSQKLGHSVDRLADYSIEILNLSHWDLFGICDLEFVI